MQILEQEAAREKKGEKTEVAQHVYCFLQSCTAVYFVGARHRNSSLVMLPSSGSASKISQVEDFSVEPPLPDPLSAEDISEDLNSLKASIGLDEVSNH